MRARRRWAMVGVLAMGSIATMTAATIVNVALPSVVGALGLGQDEAQWLSTAFLAASTGFMLLNTWAVARIGMRAAFACAMAAFIGGSALGAVAQDLWLLVLGRVMQGAGAGLIQPMALLVIYRLFPEGSRGSAIGFYSLCVIASPAFGPAVGGAMIEAYEWRVIFVATAPLALAAIPLGLWLLPKHDAGEPVRLDLAGLVLVMAAATLALQSFQNGAREGWDDPGTHLRLVGAIVTTLAFLLWESRCPSPLLDLRLFARPGFCVAGVAIFLTGAGVYGTTWVAPLFVQLIQHYGPAGAGEIMLPAGVAMAVLFPIAGRLSDRVDARVLIAAGAVMSCCSMLMLSEAGPATEFTAIAAALALGRAGYGAAMPAANASAMRHAAGMHAPAAPAATLLTQTGGALGIAAVSALLQHRTAFHADALVMGVNADFALSELSQVLRESGLSVAESHAMAMAQATRALGLTSQMMAFRDCFMAAAVTALLLLPVALLSPVDRWNFTDRLKAALTLFR